MADSRSPWGRNPDLPHGLHGRLPGVIEPRCPNCREGLGGYTAVKLDGATPRPGDLTVCCYCEVVLQYAGSPLDFVRVEGDELILARAHPDVRLALRVVSKLRAKGQIPRPGNVIASFPNRQQRRAAERRARAQPDSPLTITIANLSPPPYNPRN